jgi:hypothetical protein
LDGSSEQAEGRSGVVHELAVQQARQQWNNASIGELGRRQLFGRLINDHHQASDPQQWSASKG